MERRIIVNQIRTPDGTVLRSRSVHDYVTHTDKNGLEYMVDGGPEYLRRNEHKDHPYEEISLYDDSPIEVIRENFHRGGRGKDGTQPLTWVPLKDMSDKWLLNTINYVLKSRGAEYDRIPIWTQQADQWFNLNRNVMAILIRHHMKKEGIDNLFLDKVYVAELEYRIQHEIYVPDEEEEAEKARWSLWGTLRNLVGL